MLSATAHPETSFSGFSDAVQDVLARLSDGAQSRQTVYLRSIQTPLGSMVAGATDDALCLLEFSDRTTLERQLKTLRSRFHCTFSSDSNEVLKRTLAEVEAYVSGDLWAFTVPILSPGTPFQQNVWQALQAIPYGTTVSYGALAYQLDQSAAVRAVAKANGDNRIALIIPCHRVIGADGTLTGYAGGLHRKQWLLDHERKHATGMHQAELFG